MDKFVIRLEGNGLRDLQSSNADSRSIAPNGLENSSPRTEQQVPHSSRKKHEIFSLRQKQIVLDAKKEAEERSF